MKKSIYIIKNKINSKVYIGQTSNIHQRWAQYKSAAKNIPNKQLITKAMKKYGIENFYVEILEDSIIDFNEREKYWINKYDSISPNGYNILIGGDGLGSGLDNPNSLIKTSEILNLIINDIKYSEESLKTIAERYNLNYGRIVEINSGKKYYIENEVYPLRGSNKYKQDKLEKIINSLLYDLDKNLVDISKIYNIDLSYLHDINKGEAHYRDYLKYPLRVGKMNKAKEVHPQIQELLINSSLTQQEICKKFNVSEIVVSNINTGKVSFNVNYEYPIRKIAINSNRTNINPILLDEIRNIIKNTSMSLKSISEKYKLPYSTIQGINSGKLKKYKNDKLYKYPLR